MSTQQPVAEIVDNLVHEDTQVTDLSVDLTVSAIYEVDEPGRLDFGGDELEDATFEPVPTEPRHPDDDYEWWELSGGQYVFQYNEFIATEPEVPLFVQPRNELLARGGSHPSVTVYSHLPLMSLSVADGGINIKENARLSVLIPISIGAES